jgi:hypothetical protein
LDEKAKLIMTYGNGSPLIGVNNDVADKWPIPPM